MTAISYQLKLVKGFFYRTTKPMTPVTIQNVISMQKNIIKKVESCDQMLFGLKRRNSFCTYKAVCLMILEKYFSRVIIWKVSFDFDAEDLNI